MTFDLLERARRLGRPVALLRLTRGSLVERYANAPGAVVVGAETFVPLSIERSALRDSGERLKSVVTITLPIDAPCVDWWRPYPPSTRVGVAWLAKHAGDDELAVEWTGRVIGRQYTDRHLILKCEQGRTTARSRGLALKWCKGCPLSVYSQGTGMCNVDKTLHKVEATLTDVDGLKLTATEFGTLPDGRLAGGFVEWTRPDGEPETRSIVAHVGDEIFINYGTDTLAVASGVIAYKGCAGTWEDCTGEFGNGPNFGGCRRKPVRSPMDGNPV
jgi:hypothetical protein